jgi:hypothetical protein
MESKDPEKSKTRHQFTFASSSDSYPKFIDEESGLKDDERTQTLSPNPYACTHTESLKRMAEKAQIDHM